MIRKWTIGMLSILLSAFLVAAVGAQVLPTEESLAEGFGNDRAFGQEEVAVQQDETALGEQEVQAEQTLTETPAVGFEQAFPGVDMAGLPTILVQPAQEEGISAEPTLVEERILDVRDDGTFLVEETIGDQRVIVEERVIAVTETDALVQQEGLVAQEGVATQEGIIAEEGVTTDEGLPAEQDVIGQETAGIEGGQGEFERDDTEPPASELVAP